MGLTRMDATQTCTISGAECASRLETALTERGCDYTLLFWLRQPHALRKSVLHDQMVSFLDEFGLSLDNFSVTDAPQQVFLRDFFQHLREIFAHRGIRPVQPKHVIIAKNKGGKAEVLSKYQAELAAGKWPCPHQIYCMQTMGDGDVLFILTQTWQDGLILQRDMLKLRNFTFNFRNVSVLQVYEHQFCQPLAVNLIVDWEIMLSAYEHRVTAEQVQKVAEDFPVWLVSRLREVRAIESDARIECVVKDKTRAKKDSGDLKISKHFIFNISGVTMGGHYEAMKLAIEPWVQRLQLFQKNKTLAHVCDKDLLHPVWGWDNRLLRGQNGISTLFGCKKGEMDAPPPKMVHRLILTPGGVDTQKFSWNECEEHSIEKLGDLFSLSALYRSAYTTPKVDMVAYDRDFLRRVQEVGGEAAGCSSASSSTPARVKGAMSAKMVQLHAQKASQLLPAWFMNCVPKGLNITVNTTMQCLKRKQVGLMEYLKAQGEANASELIVARYGGAVPCPVQLLEKGQVHMHRNNGVYMAVWNNKIYARCTTCTMSRMDCSRDICSISSSGGKSSSSSGAKRKSFGGSETQEKRQVDFEVLGGLSALYWIVMGEGEYVRVVSGSIGSSGSNSAKRAK